MTGEILKYARKVVSKHLCELVKESKNGNSLLYVTSDFVVMIVKLGYVIINTTVS